MWQTHTCYTLLQANEVYVTMKSVLEALSGKPQIAASPSLQSMAPPTTASSEDHIYDRVPTNRTSTYQPITVTVTTSGMEHNQMRRGFLHVLFPP